MESETRLPLLWVHGPPGVGKSTTGWRIFEQLQHEGRRAGFVDIDQLGICYPEPKTDPGRYQLKTANLAALAANFAAAGCQAMVVPGVVDPVHGVDGAGIDTATVVACRLRLGPDGLEGRRRARGDGARAVQADRLEAEQIERLSHEPAIDVDGLTVDEVAGRVRQVIGPWPPEGLAPVRPSNKESRVPAGPPVLWLCGPPAVGKSTVGFEVYSRLLGAGVPMAYLDLAQIGCLRPHVPADPSNHRLKAANLASIWARYRAAGAADLVMTGPVAHPADIARYLSAVGGSGLTVARLQAGPSRLRQRVEARGRDEGWRDVTDRLRGADAETLERAWHQAVAVAGELDAAQPGDFSVPTDDRAPAEIAQEILDNWWGPDGRPRNVAAR